MEEKERVEADARAQTAALCGATVALMDERASVLMACVATEEETIVVLSHRCRMDGCQSFSFWDVVVCVMLCNPDEGPHRRSEMPHAE